MKRSLHCFCSRSRAVHGRVCEHQDRRQQGQHGCQHQRRRQHHRDTNADANADANTTDSALRMRHFLLPSLTPTSPASVPLWTPTLQPGCYFNNFGSNNETSERADQTAVTDGYNLLIVNMVTSGSPTLPTRSSPRQRHSGHLLQPRHRLTAKKAHRLNANADILHRHRRSTGQVTCRARWSAKYTAGQLGHR